MANKQIHKKKFELKLRQVLSRYKMAIDKVFDVVQYLTKQAQNEKFQTNLSGFRNFSHTSLPNGTQENSFSMYTFSH